MIVVSSHYAVPFIPNVHGLAEFVDHYPASIEHSKPSRGPEKYRGKRVVTVGASISGPDSVAALAGVVESPLHAVVRGKQHPCFGDRTFRKPDIQRHPLISHITDRIVIFEDGTEIADVEHIIFGTGSTRTSPFLPEMEIATTVCRACTYISSTGPT